RLIWVVRHNNPVGGHDHPGDRGDLTDFLTVKSCVGFDSVIRGQPQELSSLNTVGSRSGEHNVWRVRVRHHGHGVSFKGHTPVTHLLPHRLGSPSESSRARIPTVR